ncbi:MAG: FAD-dependent thymidylate synthase [bacterium]
MRVQTVGILPTEAAKQKGRVALTPELLASTGARYSRNNEGLESIVQKIDWSNTDKAVDGIFRMVDYGHASIADMAPVAMFIDDVSLYAAFYLWSQCPTASGQESSTRYIKVNKVVPASVTGIPANIYKQHVEKSFALYHKALDLWTSLSIHDPTLMQIPQSVIDDQSEKGQKKLERMRRNFAFDRARVFLPACAKTNLMMLMSARSWVDLISLLLSHPLEELQQIGKKLRSELDLVTPRLTKHANAKVDSMYMLHLDFEALKSLKSPIAPNDGAHLELYEKPKKHLGASAKNRTNRYSMFAADIRQTLVRFGWTKIAFAELRDLNRHRTGNKLTSFKPNDFYNAQDQALDTKSQAHLDALSKYPLSLINKIDAMIQKDDARYVYFTLLGHTMQFEHVTTMDKYLYEAELRTGTGSHYRYAQHLRNTLKILYKKHPELKGLILEGTAEPE